MKRLLLFTLAVCASACGETTSEDSGNIIVVSTEDGTVVDASESYDAEVEPVPDLVLGVREEGGLCGISRPD